MFSFSIDKARQKGLEDRVEHIIDNVYTSAEGTVAEKSRSDELTKPDVLSHEIITKEAPKDVFVSTEEGDHGDSSALICEAWDPVDGSSEQNRSGRMKSPLSTAALVFSGDTILGACIGDIWNRIVYGLDESGLYFRTAGAPQKTYIQISKEKRELPLNKAMLAAYAPTAERMKVVGPLFDCVPYVHNNGGQLFALRVVEGESVKSYAVALEATPVALWEHIGPIMAQYGGAFVSRLDGTPLQLDIRLKQTSITAANECLRLGVIDGLDKVYKRLEIRHVQAR